MNGRDAGAQPGPGRRQGITPQRWFLASGAVLAVVFAVLEPSAAPGIGLLGGLGFWLLQLGILVPLLVVLQRASTAAASRLGAGPWLHTTLVGAIGGCLFTPVALLLDHLLAIPETEAHATLAPALLDELAGVVPPVTLCWLALNAPWILRLDFTPPPAPEPRPESADTVASRGGLLALLPAHLGTELVCLEAELHYLKAVTTAGEALVLYALRDAVDELGAARGIRTHRSFWVASDHVVRLTRRAGKPACLMSDGRYVPVSRRRESAVRAALAGRAGNRSPGAPRTV